jgi:ABC-type uncharacterized transport system permease subunit
MPWNLVLGLSALAALLPATLVALRRHDGRDWVFWCVIAVAIVGPLAWTLVQLGGAWRTGLSVTLWLTIAVSMLLFAGLAYATENAWRLTPLMLPYMMLLAATAMVWQQAPEQPLVGGAPSGWMRVHIGVSVLTYALCTIAAVAALAVLLQERALKAKRPSALTRLLPSVADGELLQVRLLAASGVVLGLGLVSGMATQYFETGALLEFGHKILFSFVAFLLIGALLIAHRRSGVRGRRVARLLLVAYLFLTLAYPGVKFVTDVLLT